MVRSSSGLPNLQAYRRQLAALGRAVGSGIWRRGNTHEALRAHMGVADVDISVDASGHAGSEARGRLLQRYQRSRVNLVDIEKYSVNELER